MKCPECEKLSLKSELHFANACFNLPCGGPHMYYDEEGVYHVHDNDKRSTQWWCSNKHQGVLRHESKCPNCDFGRKQELVVYRGNEF